MSDHLTVFEEPHLENATLVMGLSGWMDGGEASMGTIKYLLGELDTRQIARINPQGLYIYNFPASMEVAAIFRPHARIKDGEIKSYDLPADVFHCDSKNNLILFEGREPNMNWDVFTDCVFDVVTRFNVRTVYFLGSFGGVVPHSRDPRLYTTVSDLTMKEEMAGHGIRFANYDGPAGVVTHLIRAATERGVRMASLVAEIPAYLQGRNPKSITTLVRKLLDLLGMDLDLTVLQHVSDEFEARVSKMVQERTELADMIHNLEGQYDSDYLAHEMGDLKEWLESQGFHTN